MTEFTPADPRVFISYRRKDAGHAGRLSDRLIEHFGRAQIFQDIDSIQPGADFAEEIADAVASCQVLLALIGDGWLKVKDKEGRRRIDNPKDFVRLEIETALSCDIRVIPILLDGAKMPRVGQLPSSLAGLARHQALELSPDRDRFDFDVGRLLKALDKTFKKLQNARPLAAMQGQRLFTPPASAKPVPLDEIIAKLSPSERAAVEKFEDPQQRAIQILQLHLEKQEVLQTALDNIAQMRRDMRKAVAENKFRAD